jgi:glycine oxidase
MAKLAAVVVGGGIFGLWQAFELARRGHAVTLREAMPEEETGAASRFAGGMLAPECEAEAAPPVVRALGLTSLKMWRDAYPAVTTRGTLVVASARDLGELRRFARMTQGYRALQAEGVAALEPELEGRFTAGLHYPAEAHLVPRDALTFLVGELRRLGAALHFGQPVPEPLWLAAAAGEILIDCRGIAAREQAAGLRGVRGEMAIVMAPEVSLSRPIRLLHPRFPLYVVPWGGGVHMIGATSIESDDAGAVKVRSALELLATAYALSPAFGGARIVELSAGVRPAFPDNVPRIMPQGRKIIVNGAYRHGFLTAPALAALVADYLESGKEDPEIFAS